VASVCLDIDIFQEALARTLVLWTEFISETEPHP